MNFLAAYFSSIFLLSACLLQNHLLVDGAAQVAKTITVAQSGNADFNTIQGAINSVPDGNTQWIQIKLAQGTYKEKVTIPKTKPFILLEGQGANNTIIQWGNHAGGSLRSSILRPTNFAGPLGMDDWDTAVFAVSADNFVARSITFQNTYDYATQQDRAVAVGVGGDKCSFYNCKFLGYQDTLCDYEGRHYFSQCWIEGAVDFIWGQAASVYEGCTLNTIKGQTLTGWVTAHRKLSSPAGFVFKSCKLTGDATVYLGRAWNSGSTVVFYNTDMADIVVPAGWDAWGKDVSETTYAESGCTGPGSNRTTRLNWERTLDGQGLNSFIGDSFNNADGWISQQPLA